MFKNHLKIAWRNLLKNRLQTGINLLGLTLGTVCCLSILVYVLAQTGYDTHYSDAELLYRVRTENKSVGNNSVNSSFATAGPPIAYALKREFPEVAEATRIVYFGSELGELLRASDAAEGTYESRGYLADSTVFKLFDYRFVEGSPATALQAPNTTVLSTGLARKLFGEEAALGKTLVRGDGEQALELEVTGVFDEYSGKSHLDPNYFMSMNTPGLGAFVRSTQNFATQNFVHTYVKLSPGSDARRLEAKFPEFLQKYGASDLAAAGFDKKLFLQPVADIHLYSDGIDMQIAPVSSMRYLGLLLLLAAFIQLVACINFVNLSTARGGTRAKEIGIRKTIGASRQSLVYQFLGESMLLSLIACLLSIPLTYLALPLLNQLTQGNLSGAALLDPRVALLLAALGALTGLLAGIYPALVLSSARVINILKSKRLVPAGKGGLRKALVVSQFVVSIGLIAAAIVIYQQVRYAQQKDLGFDKENLLAVRLGTSTSQANFNALRSEVGSLAGVSEVSGSNNFPSEFMMADLGLHLQGRDPKNKTSVIYNGISENYFETAGTPLLAGRDINPADSTYTEVVVNKATMDVFGIDLENALGTQLIMEYEGNVQQYQVVGVARDFHFASLKEAIRPLLLFRETHPNWLLVRTEGAQIADVLGRLEEKWEAVNPNTPFVYTFVDQEAERLYAEEKRLAAVSSVFTVLAILLSCLGLFGLISFIAEQKKKEIGIRKVLGASVASVVQLLTRDFAILVGVALLIASPLAYYVMQGWLQDFEYRIEIHWWVFALAGTTALVISLATVGLQAVKTAMANPVNSLRTE